MSLGHSNVTRNGVFLKFPTPRHIRKGGLVRDMILIRLMLNKNQSIKCKLRIL